MGIGDDLKLAASQLFTACDPARLGFATTAEVGDLDDVVGQARALEAIRFGVSIRQTGFNVYALGTPGTGRRSVVRKLVSEQAANEPVPPDYCYINNFQDVDKPRALQMPAGRGVQLRTDMAALLEELGSVVPEALDSDECRARRQDIEERFKERQEQAFQTLSQHAEKNGLRFMRTPAGFAFAPVQEGQVIEPDAFARLSDDERHRLEERVGELQSELDRILQEMPRWRREMLSEIKQINHDVVMSAVQQLMGDLKERYCDLPQVRSHLDAVQADVIEHADRFRPPEDGQPMLAAMFPQGQAQDPRFLNRYMVNVLVDRSAGGGAPVVYLDNPTFPNLVGRVEYQSQLGALVTDFTLIKPGVLHAANGGYLLLDARKVLTQPYAWEGLKRVLRSGEITIESLGQVFSMVSSVSLEPEPIPLSTKVVLVGDRRIYYLLSEYDDEFRELFKVSADFDEVMERNDATVERYGAFLATFARQEDLHPLGADAVARVIEHASREAEDGERLSACFRRIGDLVREADYWSRQAERELIRREDVQRAIDARVRRDSRIQERMLESTLRGDLLIATDGEAVGQINGLAVITLGEHRFGHPSRISARVRLGKGEVLDIAREVKMGGPIHSKGVLILSGFLAGRYCPGKILSMSASLVFEQSYGMIDGDSASAGELFALLSALAEVPLRQTLAVTGSINQHGQIQPIGGVNEKVEGFFDLCQARGLTGEEGVIVPQANAKNLMLRQDVVEAVRAGHFNVFAIATADQGLSVLTGLEAGERDTEGKFPPATVNGRVESALQDLAAAARQSMKDDGDEGVG